MAYEKIHKSINFKDRQAPSITSEVLNRREATFEELDNRTVELSIFNESVPETYATKEELAEISETVTEIATEVSKGKADVILANESGESIHATDSTDNKAVEFALLGKATQNQYSGKNLLNNTLSNQTWVGVTTVRNDDGSISLNGTSTKADYSQIIADNLADLPNGTYILSCEYKGDFSNGAFWLHVDMNDGTQLLCGKGSEITIEITDDLKIAYIRPRCNASVTFTNVIVYPMLRLASVTDSTYEPYVGGTPSPNPDYPQEIEVSGANGSVEIKSVGKNLLKITATSKTVNSVAFTINEDGSVTANGTATGGSATLTIGEITLPKGEYILSGCPSGGSASSYWLNASSIGNDIGESVLLKLTEEKTFSIIVAVKVGATVNNLTFYPMISLEGGEYEPYKESTTVISTPNGHAGINGVNDKKVKYSDGTGQYVQRIGKAVFDGSDDEGWSAQQSFTDESGNTYYRFNIPINDAVNIVGRSKVLCTHGLFRAYTDVNKDSIGAVFMADAYLYFYIGGVYTSDELRTWLSNNPMTVYYEIAEPIITDLSAEEVAELEAVQTFYPTTNILNDEGCGMEITYRADTKNYIDRIIGERVSAIETALINNI